MASTGFPNLEPAYTMRVLINPPSSVGNVSSSGSLSVVTFAGGSMKSEPGVSPAVDAEILFGSDLIRVDPSEKHVRLDVRSLMKDKRDCLINFTYTGYIEVTPAVMKVFAGSPDAESTDFGNSFCHFTFETGNEDLKPLENRKYVGAGRFIIEQGKTTVVEYKISKVVK
ncbi:MAG: hypothetical protein M1840_006485 [Geoglossum simile]|nr:MAG: hypothetical protein M1840_006485 [Geoglossum simile]